MNDNGSLDAQIQRHIRARLHNSALKLLLIVAIIIANELITAYISTQKIYVIHTTSYRGYPAKRAIPAMLTHDR